MARALTTLLPRHRRSGKEEVRRSGKEEVPQLGGPLAAGERLTTETPYLGLDDLWPRSEYLSPRGNFDDVIKGLALRTV